MTGFTVLRASEIAVEQQRHQWLVRDLWGDQSVGIIGGPPKSCKSWLGLDLAVSVASNTACLGSYVVEQAGRVLLYMAEDALPAVRERLLCLSRHRSVDLASLDVFLIDEPSVRLDLEEHRARLIKTLERLKPRLLILDPLVRLHRCDENSAMEMTVILGFLRELQRSFSMAVILAHHTSKKHYAHPGHGLRGSSDIHAWTDSSLFMKVSGNNLVLTVEHRSAPTPEPVILTLVHGGGSTQTHLTVVRQAQVTKQKHGVLTDRVLDVLAATQRPLTRDAIRRKLGVKNQTLGQALVALEARGAIRRGSGGWIPVNSV